MKKIKQLLTKLLGISSVLFTVARTSIALHCGKMAVKIENTMVTEMNPHTFLQLFCFSQSESCAAL